jgi:uncharacterized membrane protein YdjX (TVP38/TMEM64 family)
VRDRAGITAVRDRLLAEHCGAAGEEVGRLIENGASLIGVSRRLSRNGHLLRDISDGPLEVDDSGSYIEGIADPERPLEAAEFISFVVGDRAPRPSVRTIAKIAAVVLAMLGLTLVWQFTPVSELVKPANLEAAMASITTSPWRGGIVLAAFVGGGLIAFPVNLLIAATAAAFGPVAGFAYAAAGTLASALVTYAVGAWLGRDALSNILGPRLSRIRKSVARRGILAIAAIRLIPVAPFSLVNVVAGASEIRLLDYLVGTGLGMVPGLVLMSALGHQVFLMLTDPRPSHFALLAGAIALWLALVVGLQAVLQRYREADA